MEHEGFTLCGMTLQDGTVTNLEVQDCKHCVKKLFSWLVVGRQLHVGHVLATLNHLILVFERFAVSAHRMERRHVYR